MVICQLPTLIRFGLSGLLVFTIVGTSISSTFLEVLGRQTIATDGDPSNTFQSYSANPKFGNNRIFVAYMAPNGGLTNKIMIKQYDYNTGVWSTTQVATVGQQGGNYSHNAPILHHDPLTGHLEVYYGSTDCFFRPTGDPNASPCYKRSVNPNDATSWGPELEVPSVSGLFAPEPKGGFTANGWLHLIGDGNAGQGIYFRRNTSGTWESANLFPNPNKNNDACACYGDVWISGNTIHLTWGSYLPPFNGSQEGIYYARSTDNGTTWTNAAGTASFTRTTGLARNGAYTWPSAYLVRTGTSANHGTRVRTLANGNPIISQSYPTTAVFIWNGSSWQQNTISFTGGLGNTMERASTGKLYLYVLSFGGDVYEYISTDNGATWSVTTIDFKDIEDNKLSLVSMQAAPSGERERVLLAWTNSFASSKEVKFWDRPFGNYPARDIQAPNPPQNVRVQ